MAKNIETKGSQERMAVWSPSLKHSYRQLGFDLSTLCLGRNRAVDGRLLIQTGALARFGYDLSKKVDKLGWAELNRLIAQRWRALPHAGTGRFRIPLIEVSRDELVTIEISLERGSSLPFADRTLTSIACEIECQKPKNLIARIFSRLFGIRNQNAA